MCDVSSHWRLTLELFFCSLFFPKLPHKLFSLWRLWWNMWPKLWKNHLKMWKRPICIKMDKKHRLERHLNIATYHPCGMVSIVIDIWFNFSERGKVSLRYSFHYPPFQTVFLLLIRLDTLTSSEFEERKAAIDTFNKVRDNFESFDKVINKRSNFSHSISRWPVILANCSAIDSLRYHDLFEWFSFGFLTLWLVNLKILL